MTPDDRRYLPSHEWHKLDNGQIVIGITQFAADELTDITFVQLPAVGANLKKGTAFGEIESVKATSELYSGVSGKVTAVNDALAGDPGLINRDPYQAGWMLRVQPTNPAELDALLNLADYLKETGH